MAGPADGFASVENDPTRTSQVRRNIRRVGRCGVAGL